MRRLVISQQKIQLRMMPRILLIFYNHHLLLHLNRIYISYFLHQVLSLSLEIYKK
nr:MAG TPA: hypothetical protein [Caudoviricetes sp.]